MSTFGRILLIYSAWLVLCCRTAPTLTHNGQPISAALFESLEELARIVDISYCVGSTGIQKPFQCLSRCKEFEGFELVTTWNTGPLLSDSSGYIAVSHAPYEQRVIIAFRGTYSIANTIADLSTRHAAYAPFPGTNDTGAFCQSTQNEPQHRPASPLLGNKVNVDRCDNCTIHTGFLTSWQNTRCIVLPHVEQALAKHPDYKLVLVGHSLGGAVAAIAALEFQARGYKPHVTTFGEPRLGNVELNAFIDRKFNLNATSAEKALFRRVTHVDDPVPLLPLQEWGYTMHAGEIFISKSSLPPTRSDIYACDGDSDPACIAGPDSAEPIEPDAENEQIRISGWGVPSRYKLWQLFFAHRDYFWRLGMCMPGGDPWDWNRGRDTNDSQQEL